MVPEKTDSRNFIELFDDIKSCALEVHFDFRQNECKSCETIHNQKLQKLYKYVNKTKINNFTYLWKIILVKEKLK